MTHRQGLIEHMCISLDYGSQFFCYAENGEPLYIYADMECDLDVGIEKNHSSFLEFNISPNPSTGVIDINLNSQNHSTVNISTIPLAAEDSEIQA